MALAQGLELVKPVTSSPSLRFKVAQQPHTESYILNTPWMLRTVLVSAEALCRGSVSAKRCVCVVLRSSRWQWHEKVWPHCVTRTMMRRAGARTGACMNFDVTAVRSGYSGKSFQARGRRVCSRCNSATKYPGIAPCLFGPVGQDVSAINRSSRP